MTKAELEANRKLAHESNVETLSGNVVQGDGESVKDYRIRRKEESKRTTDYLRKRSIWKGMKNG